MSNLFVKESAPTEADASAALCKQSWQFGDVARYPPRLILCKHLCYVSRVPCLTRIHVGERLAVNVTHNESPWGTVLA